MCQTLLHDTRLKVHLRIIHSVAKILLPSQDTKKHIVQSQFSDSFTRQTLNRSKFEVCKAQFTLPSAVAISTAASLTKNISNDAMSTHNPSLPGSPEEIADGRRVSEGVFSATSSHAQDQFHAQTQTRSQSQSHFRFQSRARSLSHFHFPTRSHSKPEPGSEAQAKQRPRSLSESHAYHKDGHSKNVPGFPGPGSAVSRPHKPHGHKYKFLNRLDPRYNEHLLDLQKKGELSVWGYEDQWEGETQETRETRVEEKSE